MVLNATNLYLYEQVVDNNTGFTTTGKSIVDSLTLCDGESRFEAEIYYLYGYFVDNTGFNKTGERELSIC